MTMKLLRFETAARNIAIQAHTKAGNTYSYGEKGEKLPYFVHLEDVVETLLRHGVQDATILSAAWLHDTLEDTDMTAEQLKKLLVEQFNKINPNPFDDEYDVSDTSFEWSPNNNAAYSIIKIVEAVTNPATGTRAEKHAISYPVIAASPAAVAVKLADRIANMSSGGKSSMYVKEHPFFFGSLYRKNYNRLVLEEGLQTMWDTYLINIARLNESRPK